MKYAKVKISELEYLRYLAKQRFDKVRGTWVDLCKWALPHRNNWMLSQTEGERRNQHIVDSTHIIDLRSFVAGFLEGNTSVTRPWFRTGTGNKEVNLRPNVHEWLDMLTQRCLKVLLNSNFYHAAGAFYYDYGTVNTGAHLIEEVENNLFFHTLIPGSYFLINDSYGEAVCMIREYANTVKALVDHYGPKKENGSRDWSNISDSVRKMYDDGNYTHMIDVVQVIRRNEDFKPEEPQVLLNREWISISYELAGSFGHSYQDGLTTPGDVPDPEEAIYLEVKASSRKPFIAGRSTTFNNFEYGEKGPTSDALGLIKSLNKKAIGKDQALEQMLRPALQGPANLRKSYITTASNSYIPLDATSLSQKGLRPVFEVNQGVGALIQDVGDMRQQVDKHYFADFLLFLSSNPKTRTATEAQAVVNEQRMVIGPNLQSLNWTYNTPVVEYVLNYVLDTDPFLPPPPEELEGQFLRPEFISVFAQAQKAADLPSVDRYMAMIMNVGAIDPRIMAKANLDKLADLYEDRLYLPAGLNNPNEKAEAIRQKALAQREKAQQMEQMVQASTAAKNMKDVKQQNTGDGS
jgi:uncharacterized protein YfkK (UPF0435 family)